MAEQKGQRTEKTVTLGIGDMIIGCRTDKVTTVLGPCIGVTFYHRESQFSAICHCKHASPFQPNDFSNNYLSVCLPKMLSAFRRRDLDFKKLEVKVFGGANMFVNSLGIPERSLQEVDRFCRENSLKVVFRDHGGNEGRHLTFYPKTGQTEVNTIVPGSLTGTKEA